MKWFNKVVATVFAWLLFSVPIMAIAADLSEATYVADITVTNNGSAASNQSTVFTLNSTSPPHIYILVFLLLLALCNVALKASVYCV